MNGEWVKNIGLSRKTNITLAHMVCTTWILITVIDKLGISLGIWPTAGIINGVLVLIYLAMRRGREMQFELDKKEMEQKK